MDNTAVFVLSAIPGAIDSWEISFQVRPEMSRFIVSLKRWLLGVCLLGMTL